MLTKYQKSLLDERWLVLSHQIKKRDNFQCQFCKEKKVQLHVHHKFYESEYAYEALPKDLITLCKGCHQNVHNIQSRELSKISKLLKTLFFNPLDLQVLLTAFLEARRLDQEHDLLSAIIGVCERRDFTYPKFPNAPKSDI